VAFARLPAKAFTVKPLVADVREAQPDRHCPTPDVSLVHPYLDGDDVRKHIERERRESPRRRRRVATPRSVGPNPIADLNGAARAQITATFSHLTG
jgi:hypothetical protein